LLVGYARVSTPDQKLDLQLDQLKAYGCENIFYDIASGVSAERLQLKEALKFMRSGDVLVVWKLDRLGRSLSKLIDFINGLQTKGIGFKSLQDAIDTTTPQGKFFFHITGAFAELERDLIRERTQAGLQAARARGRKGGRPKAIDDKTFQIALKLYQAKDMPVSQICQSLNINRRTFDRYMLKIKNV
jgi:DNA invertase Pin-like site-specific DNA recombinase